MAYLGKAPDGTGVRSRFYYTQGSSGATSISGADDAGKTLVYSDGAYVDVLLNGTCLVAGTDYNTNTSNTIAGLTALASGDVVEVVVYDIFAVADTVSQKDGGAFLGNVTAPKFQTNNTLLDTAIFRTHDQTVSVNTTIDATKNALAIGPLTVADGVTITVASGGNLTIL